MNQEHVSNQKKLITTLLLSCILTMLISMSAFAASPKLSKTKANLKTGQKITLRVKNTKTKPVWSTTLKV